MWPLLSQALVYAVAGGIASSGSRSAVLPSWQLLRGGQAISAEAILKMANDPEAAEELRKLMEDPEAMREAREMMDNPEFRAQMLEAAGSMGAGKMAQLKDTLESNSDLVDSLQQLGPSLGTALDILMRSTTAEEFDEACTTLDGLCRRLADKGRDDIKYRRLRLTNGALQQRLLRHDAGQSCLEALGFRTRWR